MKGHCEIGRVVAMPSTIPVGRVQGSVRETEGKPLSAIFSHVSVRFTSYPIHIGNPRKSEMQVNRRINIVIAVSDVYDFACWCAKICHSLSEQTAPKIVCLPLRWVLASQVSCVSVGLCAHRSLPQTGEERKKQRTVQFD